MARKNRESIYIYSEVKIHCLKDEIIYLKMSKKRQAENSNISTTKSQRHEAWHGNLGLPGICKFSGRNTLPPLTLHKYEKGANTQK